MMWLLWPPKLEPRGRASTVNNLELDGTFPFYLDIKQPRALTDEITFDERYTTDY